MQNLHFTYKFICLLEIILISHCDDLQTGRTILKNVSDTHKLTSDVIEDLNEISGISTVPGNDSTEESFTHDFNDLTSNSMDKHVKSESGITSNLKDLNKLDDERTNLNVIHNHLIRKSDNVVGNNSTDRQNMVSTNENHPELIAEIRSAQGIPSNPWLILNRITRKTKNKRSVDAYDLQSTGESTSDFIGNDERTFATTSFQFEDVSSNPLINDVIRGNENNESLASKSDEKSVLDFTKVTNLTDVEEKRETNHPEQDLKNAEFVYPFWYYENYYPGYYWLPHRRTWHHFYPRIPVFTGK